MWLLVALAVVVIGLTHWLLNGSYGYWKKRGIPNPPTKPWVGNLGDSFIMRRSLGQIYSDIYNNYKDHRYVGFFKIQKPGLVIRDVELIKIMTVKEFASFHDNDIEVDENVDPILGKNPFCLKGQRWKNVRSQVTTAITSGKIKAMFNLMNTASKSLVTYLENEENSTEKDGLETKELAAKYTTDVVASCAFGLDGNSFTDPNSEFRKMGRKMFNPDFFTGLKFVLMFALPWLNKIFKLRFMSPEVHNWFVGTLQETINYREKNNIFRNDYLDLMISLKTKPGEYKFTDMDVISQAMTFYGDGFETSSITLSFAFLELASNPEIQENLYEEIKNVLLKHDGVITYEGIQEMNYLDMIISETLRKYPPGMFLAKQCTKAFTFPSSTYDDTGPALTIEPGMAVVFPVFAIHYDPAYYPDPEKFDPERFTDEAKSARPKCAYLPFGEGPRMCLGFRFALAQIKAALVAVITNFEVKMNPKTSPTFEIDPQNLMLSKVGGIWLNYHKRSKQ